MANLGQTFDAAELPRGTGSYDPLPAGWYSVTVASAELKPTKDGSGQYIKLRYDVTGPSHQGRVVFGNLNVKNQSAKAEEIGRQQLGDLMRAIGLSKVTDTDQLVGGRLSIKLDVRAGDEKYAAQNEVRGFRADAHAAPSFSPPAPPAASSDPGASKAKAAPPWAKK